MSKSNNSFGWRKPGASLPKNFGHEDPDEYWEDEGTVTAECHEVVARMVGQQTKPPRLSIKTIAAALTEIGRRVRGGEMEPVDLPGVDEIEWGKRAPEKFGILKDHPNALLKPFPHENQSPDYDMSLRPMFRREDGEWR